MRIHPIVLACLALSVVLPARAGDGAAFAGRLIQAGAPELVLAEARAALSRGQPDPLWVDLAWQAANHLDRLPDFALPPPAEAATPAARRGYWRLTGRAAWIQGDAATARTRLAPLLWQDGATPAEMAEARHGLARVALIEVGQGVDEALLPTWLRLLQDYPERRQDAGAAVADLLRSGQTQLALRLVEGLGLDGVTALHARFQAGAVTVDQADAALAALAIDPNTVEALRLRLALADARGDVAGRVDALERLVAAHAEPAAALWPAYATLAEKVANRLQLLVGADEQWLEQARALVVVEPLPARAMFAWLTRQARDPGLRGQAAAMLADALGAAKLSVVAPGLFATAPFELPPLGEPIRYRLGEWAAAQGAHALATRFWSGVTQPISLTPREWLLRRADVASRAGQTAEAGELLARLARNAEALSPGLASEAVALLQRLAGSGACESIETTALALLPPFSPALQGALWFLLAEQAAARGDHGLAGGRFVLAAGLVSADAVAGEARRRAAWHLERAGFAGDAARQRDWPGKLANSAPVSDAAQIR